MAATSNLVQYILIRKDLLPSLRWPIGAVIAQGCHASTAALQLFKDDLDTIEYLKDLDNMHKVVLEIPDETELKNLAKELNENSINHKLWYEQPEAIPTCIALKPYPKTFVKNYLSKYKLYKS